MSKLHDVHDMVWYPWWHEMETFPRYWPFVMGIRRWIPLTKASDADLWRFLWYPLEQTVKQTIETLVIWDVIAHIITSLLQYIPRNMHTVFALLCFVVAIHWLIFPYPSGLLHWHCGNLTIAPVPAKQPWWIWINTSCEFIMNDCITTTKQSTTKPCAYFLGYTVCHNDYMTCTIWNITMISRHGHACRITGFLWGKSII